MRNQKGITLIALVITIIVLLILAGVSIAMLTGDNGLLSRSQQSIKDNAIAGAKDEVSTEVQALMAQFLQDKYSNTAWTANATNDDARQYVMTNIESKITESRKHGCTIEYGTTTTGTITIKKDGRQAVGTVAANGTLTWAAIGNAS